MTNEDGAAGVLRGVALAFLRAVDEGRPAGELARELALETLRRSTPDSPAWWGAVATLEGGPLRIRHAVELAGRALDADVQHQQQRTAG